jgi:hypothetical protein
MVFNTVSTVENGLRLTLGRRLKHVLLLTAATFISFGLVLFYPAWLAKESAASLPGWNRTKRPLYPFGSIYTHCLNFVDETGSRSSEWCFASGTFRSADTGECFSVIFQPNDQGVLVSPAACESDD